MTLKTGDKFYRYENNGLHIQTFLRFEDGPFGIHAVMEQAGRTYHTASNPLQNWYSTESKARVGRLQELRQQLANKLEILQDAREDYEAIENEISHLTTTKTEV